MNANPLQNNIKKILAIIFILSSVSLLFAKEPASGDKQKDVSGIQETARSYRLEGYRRQELGDFDSALAFYQKAVQLDPSYAVAYNDLGVVYEAKGWADRAEKAYLQALKLDPGFLSAYSNLALFYEDRRDLERAYAYWKKRAELGTPEDTWTVKARKRMDDLIEVTPSLRKELLERETAVLMRRAAEQKRAEKEKQLIESKSRLADGKRLYNKGRLQEAMLELEAAVSLDPENQKARALLDKAAQQLKKKEKNDRINYLQEHFQKGLSHYKNDDLQAMKSEFERMLELSASPQKR